MIMKFTMQNSKTSFIHYIIPSGWENMDICIVLSGI